MNCVFTVSSSVQAAAVFASSAPLSDRSELHSSSIDYYYYCYEKFELQVSSLSLGFGANEPR